MTLKSMTRHIHPAGWPFIGIFGGVTVVFAFFGWPFFFIGIILTAWCTYFFRDPVRITPVRPGLIVSPADGKIVAIKEVKPEPALGFGDEPRIRISIFLNIFDVHVNRMPADGTIISTNYRKGKFVNASLEKASESNERMAVALQLLGEHLRQGQVLGVVQIAGLIARRIVCTAGQGHRFRAGEHYGLIRFGSRTDIYLPPGLQPLVAIGQYMLGGETVLADCQATEARRIGEVR